MAAHKQSRFHMPTSLLSLVCISKSNIKNGREDDEEYGKLEWWYRALVSCWGVFLWARSSRLASGTRVHGGAEIPMQSPAPIRSVVDVLGGRYTHLSSSWIHQATAQSFSSGQCHANVCILRRGGRKGNHTADDEAKQGHGINYSKSKRCCA